MKVDMLVSALKQFKYYKQLAEKAINQNPRRRTLSPIS
jgi:hypothetical protein